MTIRCLHFATLLLLWSVPAAVTAQTPMPTSQPSIVTIFREDVKYGHNADHEKTEMGWPAAYAKAKAPGTYIALTSMTGPSEAWFVQPFASWKAFGDGMKFESDNAELSAELARLQKADAEHVSAGRSIHLASRADLSAGTFPNVAKIRFYEITWFRVRPGHEQEFERLAKVFQAGYKKAAPQASYRLYQVAAGMPGPTYVVFGSYQTIAELDKGPATDAAVMATFSAADQSALQKFGSDGLVNSETQRFAMNGPMSYVDQSTIAQDPAFWRPKKASPKKTTP
jgi:hypothetical protein